MRPTPERKYCVREEKREDRQLCVGSRREARVTRTMISAGASPPFPLSMIHPTAIKLPGMITPPPIKVEYSRSSGRRYPRFSIQRLTVRSAYMPPRRAATMLPAP